MNDFNDFSNGNQTEYVNEETPRSRGWGLGLLVIALLVGGLAWLFLSGSAPALSPDIRILTQYEDDFVFDEYTRYRLLLSNQGQAPSLSRLTVMSTLSQDAIPETVSAPAPWSCTLQPHAVNCQASGMVSAGQSLPAIEITTKLPQRKEDGSNSNVRICAAVNTLLDNDLSNNEVCEIVTLLQPDIVKQEADETSESESAEVTESDALDNNDSEGNEVSEESNRSEGNDGSEDETVKETPAAEDSPLAEESDTEVVENDGSENEIAEAEPTTEDSSIANIEEEGTSTNDEAPVEDEPATQRSTVVVQIGDQEKLSAEAAGQILIPVELEPQFNDTIMTVATLQIHFDPEMVEPIACGENPDRVWEIAVCNPAYGDGLMRLSVLSTAGVSGASRIAEVEFNVIGSVGTSTPVTGTIVSLVDENQEDIGYEIRDSLIVIEQ